MSDTDTKTLAAELREAASLMRERTQAVPQEWRLVRTQIIAVGTDQLPGTDVIGECQVPARAAYVASMHPAVVLAVADWLENEAKAAVLVANAEDTASILGLPDSRAVAVARAYLGRPDPA